MYYASNEPNDFTAIASALVSAIICGLIMLH
jgi:hypothetical protein